MKSIGVGLIGSGFMGKAHALAWNAVRPVFGDVPDIRLVHLGEMNEELAQAKAAEFGFEKASGDWRKVIADPEVDVVSITTPNKFHLEMTTAALAAGKHVWCEKPMAPNLPDAEKMLAAARASGKVAVLGYNYIQNPVIRHIGKLLAEGAIGAGQPCPHRDGRGFHGRSGSAVPAAPRGRQRLWRDRRFRACIRCRWSSRCSAASSASCATWPSPIRRARRRRASARSRSTTSPPS